MADRECIECCIGKFQEKTGKFLMRIKGVNAQKSSDCDFPAAPQNQKSDLAQQEPLRKRRDDRNGARRLP
ncbi:hypothetical protein K2O51_00335 [Cupriavidus pinatubonensis]|uniref:hypothetical protein n=1 Tax=Cupriavidus pinatubonensis TaxID=248026 RepID=UPI001C736F25|nr:hypothetical protein [Cupriavidus pinatubonensis]QYY28717.1 hypothetical protein K2O51_00335 [Cupriavidus pinatubonensis]